MRKIIIRRSPVQESIFWMLPSEIQITSTKTCPIYVKMSFLNKSRFILPKENRSKFMIHAIYGYELTYKTLKSVKNRLV